MTEQSKRYIPQKSKDAFSIAKDLLTAYSEILFLNDRRVGLGVLLLSFIQPNIAFAGLLAAFSVQFFVFIGDLKIPETARGVVLYNSILVGMSIGFIFKIVF